MLAVRELTERDVEAAAPLFDERETRLRLGDRPWPAQAPRLVAESDGRFAYAVEQGGELLAIVGAEVGHGRAAAALVSAPCRGRRGIGRAALEEVGAKLGIPLLVGVERGNDGAMGPVRSTTFERLGRGVDDARYVYYLRRV